MFTAKKTIPQSEVDITSGRPLLTPPSYTETIETEGKPETIKHQGTINFQIDGIKPIGITDSEYDSLYTILEKIAKRITELKNITKKELSVIPK